MQRTILSATVIFGLIMLWQIPSFAEQRGAKVEPGTGGPSATLGASPSGLEPVEGQYCRVMGDDETPAKAKKVAEAQAREQAVSSYRVYVQSASTVKNFQLEDDLILNLSAGMLENARTTFEEKGREFCAHVTAKLNPVKVEELIQQQIKAKQVAQQVQQPLLVNGSAFGIKVWTNKDDGRFVEGDSLIVSVQSDRDGYLKLDYFQADGSVVHLVPNIYGGEAFIRAGQVYTFGGPGGREKFTISEPFGAEAIKALVSSQPFDQALTATRNVEDSRGYLQGLTRGVRGVNVGTGAGSAPQWAETSTSLATASKAVVEHNATRGLRGKSQPPQPTKPTPITGGIGSRPDEKSSRP